MLKTALKHITVSSLVLLSKTAFVNAANPIKNDTLKVSELHFGTRPEFKNEDPGNQALSKKQLVKIIDSLLDLESIDSKEIELVSYYNTLLSNDSESNNAVKTQQLSNLNFYENLEESIIFPVIPEIEITESQVFEIENEGLSYYSHPKSGVITSYYGWRDKQMHKGIDIDLIKGEPVVAAFDGKVRIAKKRGGYGNVVVLMHPNGLETVYAHLSKFKVTVGQVVLSGQTIGLGGSTGRSTGSHLHFEIRYKGHALNPSTIVSFEENKLIDKTVILKKSRYGICAFPGNSVFHTVERGDNWYSIAKKYGLSNKQLCGLNGTPKRYYLKVGQKLRIS